MINKTIQQAVISSFEKKCILVLVEAYFQSISEKKCKREWKEKSFSSHLVKHMNRTELAINYRMTITKEEELEEDDIDDGIKDPDKANPIDIRFHKYTGRNCFKYCVEAKNISSSNWFKINGARVDSSSQRREYIKEGVDRFVSGHYINQNGCMIAYNVNGRIVDTIKLLNLRFAKLNRQNEQIYKANSIKKLKIYESKHLNRKLKHLFLDYSFLEN